MDLWGALNTDQQLTALLALFSVLVGGAISTIASWVVTSQSLKAQRRLRESENRELLASMAKQAMVKLMMLGSVPLSLKDAVDAQFASADEEGLSHLLPVHKIQEFVAVDVDIDRINPKEVSFLLHGSDAPLLGDIMIFEQRVGSILQVVLTYNAKRNELAEMLEKGALSTGGEAGNVLSTELCGADALLANVKTAALNNLIGEIVERLDRDAKDGLSLLKRFQSAARAEFGALFPELNVEEPIKC